MKEITITKNEENQRLDKYLLKYLNKANKSFVYKMLRKKRIKLDGKKAEGNEILKDGDTLQLYIAEETLASFMEEKSLSIAKRHFAIVYEDDDVLAVSKPAGLLTHPETSADTDTLIDQVLYYLHEKGQYTPSADSTFTPALCNRLDRNTSGIILAGKTLRAVQILNEAIRENRVQKYYLTLVKGKIQKAGEISAYLTKDSQKNQVEITAETRSGAKQTKTLYRPIATAEGTTLLEIQLITGKTHQIRAHMQSIGHPIVGDRKYGDMAMNERFRRDFGLSNQFLHAYRLVFGDMQGALSHLSGKEIVADLPKVLAEIKETMFR